MAQLSGSCDVPVYVVSTEHRRLEIWAEEPSGAIVMKKSTIESVRAGGIRIAPDGSSVVLFGRRDIDLWRPFYASGIETFRTLPSNVMCAEYTHDSKQIITGCVNGDVYMLNVDGRRMNERLLRGHISGVECVATSRDKKWVVSGSSDRTARIWSLKRNETVHVLTGHTGTIVAAAISYYDAYVATASTDATVRIWRLERGELVAVIQHDSQFVGLAFLHNSYDLVTTGADGNVCLWNWHTEPGARGGLLAATASLPSWKQILPRPDGD